MTRTLLALVPAELPAAAGLSRFHADATDAPLLSVVRWASRGAARTRQLALSRDRRRLLELQRVEDARSWFVGGRVLQSGALTLFSPLDALFVLLDAAWAHRARFSSLYDLLARSGNTWLLQLETLTPEAVERLCDVQRVGGEQEVDDMYVKASEEKVTRWLRAKVERAAAVLANQEAQANAIMATQAAAVEEQVNLPGVEKKSNQEGTQGVTQEDVVRHYRQAIDVVGDYLPTEWIDLLCKEFGVEKQVEVKVVPKAAEGGPLDTFKRFDRRQTPENTAKRPTPSSAGAAKKKSKLANVDRTGMKSLTSFFGKK
ncbi:Ribonuclease H2 subunit B [Phytophthora cinnamomi]|uniref:Ribonuclease H2 subunit B n=1 Tax=Phytophthora cinnamomi TaxID=4785 RepID=UPI00355A4A5C|nr:Ribonuclease H2 subunit B [Phytophthora cinnamomi]